MGRCESDLGGEAEPARVEGTVGVRVLQPGSLEKVDIPVLQTGDLQQEGPEKTVWERLEAGMG